MKPRRKHPEDDIQMAIVAYLRAVLAPQKYIIQFTKNELKKQGHAAMLEAGRANKMGLCRGFPDLSIIGPANQPQSFLEVKSPTGRTSAHQVAVHQWLKDLGHNIAVVRSIDDVQAHLETWNIPTKQHLGAI